MEVASGVVEVSPWLHVLYEDAQIEAVQAGYVNFYPEDAKTPEARLRYYASQFPIVEVDSSYYAIPSDKTAKLWVERTPDGRVVSRRRPVLDVVFLDGFRAAGMGELDHSPSMHAATKSMSAAPPTSVATVEYM